MAAQRKAARRSSFGVQASSHSVAVVKWDPSNAKDNSQSGYTGNVYIDAYTISGARLWRIDLGRNIRAGAHYTQVMVSAVRIKPGASSRRTVDITSRSQSWLHQGRVRANAFRKNVTTGLQAFSSGFPIDLTPVQLGDVADAAHSNERREHADRRRREHIGDTTGQCRPVVSRASSVLRAGPF